MEISTLHLFRRDVGVFLGAGAGYGVFSLPFVVVNPDLR